MKKKIVSLVLVLVLVLVSIYIFIYNKDSKLEKNIDDSKSISQKNIDDSKSISQKNINEKLAGTNALVLNQEISKPVRSTSVKKLSAEAEAAYKKAIEYGWSSIVDDFEKNSFQNTKMSDQERNKLCDNTIINVTEEDLRRLLKSNCRPTGKYVSNLLINNRTLDKNGNLDQNEIIKKLRLLNTEGLLILKNTYDERLKEDKFGKIEITLFDRAVSLGADRVIDYVSSIGSIPTANRNPIFTQITGKPNVTTIKKLIDMGYTSDKNVITYINTYDFERNYPEIYNLLK